MLGAAVLSHRFISHLRLASVVAAVSATIVFPGLAFLKAGHIDLFIPIAFVITFTCGFLGSLFVGYFMRLYGFAAMTTPENGHFLSIDHGITVNFSLLVSRPSGVVTTT